jgi:hypothetical protein
MLSTRFTGSSVISIVVSMRNTWSMKVSASGSREAGRDGVGGVVQAVKGRVHGFQELGVVAVEIVAAKTLHRRAFGFPPASGDTSNSRRRPRRHPGRSAPPSRFSTPVPRAGRRRPHPGSPSVRPSASTASGRRASTWSLGMWNWWWRVAKCAATASEYSNSLPRSSGWSSNPTEKVIRSSTPCSASRATSRLESRPPESSTPTLTSAINRRFFTAARRVSWMASRHSASLQGLVRTGRGQLPVDAALAAGRSRRCAAHVAGASLRTPFSRVRGAGTTACRVRWWCRASGSMDVSTGSARPPARPADWRRSGAAGRPGCSRAA